MMKKRGILLGVFLVAIEVLSLLSGGLMVGEVYALPVAGTLSDGREYVLDATGNPFTLPEGVKAEEIPAGVDVVNYVQELKSKKNEENFNPDNWQLDDGRYVTRDANGNYVVLPEGKKPDDIPEGVDPNAYAQDPVKYAENNGDTSNAIEDIKDTCAGAGGAQSLGWIVCPTISILSSAAEGLYDSMLEPLLRVDPVLFTGGSGENSSNVTREQGWAIFRDIANGVVIALLLLVIFSQLTGIGIDNYGIKKVLPKIIVAAILVNLSYWICVAFVDLSNILGSGLQQMFDGLASNDNLTLDTSNIDKGGTANLGSGGSTLVSVGVLAALGTVGGVMVWSNPALILTLLISAIGVVISVLFLFILFAVREAAIVMLVVVSPVAIACYMLPNTKNVFNRWMKIFEGLLLVYPVTGLLMGGGNFVARLLLSGGMSNSGAFATFTAMIVGVVPIFFIPSLLRNSFNAMGRVGARITGLGSNVGSRLQRSVQRSPGFRSAMMRADERYMRRMAGIGDDDKANKIGRFGRIIRGGTRSIQDSRSRYKHFVAMTGNKNWDPSNPDQYNNELGVIRNQIAYKNDYDRYMNMDSNELKEAAKTNNVSQWIGDESVNQTRMNALLTAMQEKGGMDNDIFALLDANPSVGEMTSVMDMLAGSKNKALKAYGKKGKGISYETFMRGTDPQGRSMAEYINSKGPDFVNDIDDKVLQQINKYDNQAITTQQLLQVVSQSGDGDTVAEASKMLSSRNDLEGKLSGAQLANMSASAITGMSRDQNGMRKDSTSAALRDAAFAAMNDPQLASQFTGDKQDAIIDAMNNEDLRKIYNSTLAVDNPFRVAAMAEYSRRTAPPLSS